MQKAPDDISTGRAAAILTQIDLGADWTIELLDGTAEDLAAIFEDGARQALPLVGFASGNETTNEARANVGLPPVDGGDVVPTIVDQPHARAIAWAQDHAADLITGIEDRTRDMLQSTVVEALEQGWGARELADQLSESAGFSDYRAETIARTELIRSHAEGSLQAYRESGVATGKIWITAGDDLVEEVCQANEDEGPIPLEDDFPSGDPCPPAHPNCRCVLSGSVEPLETADE